MQLFFTHSVAVWVTGAQDTHADVHNENQSATNLLHELVVQAHQESRPSLDPDVWCCRARLEVHSHHKGVGAVGVVVAGAGVDALAGLLLPFNGFEVDGGHRADELHGLGLHQVAGLLVPASPLQKEALHPHTILHQRRIACELNIAHTHTHTDATIAARFVNWVILFYSYDWTADKALQMH